MSSYGHGDKVEAPPPCFNLNLETVLRHKNLVLTTSAAKALEGALVRKARAKAEAK